MSKVIVIGAGVGGMSAAARLAKAGHDVTVFESNDRTGGKCQTRWVGDYAFDTRTFTANSSGCLSRLILEDRKTN
jgi:phytoene dehydrogenase-like protein